MSICFAKALSLRVAFQEIGFGSPVDEAQRVLEPERIFTMKPTKEELLDIIYQSLEEVNEQLPNDQQIQKSPDTILVGRSRRLGFVWDS